MSPRALVLTAAGLVLAALVGSLWALGSAAGDGPAADQGAAAALASELARERRDSHAADPAERVLALAPRDAAEPLEPTRVQAVARDASLEGRVVDWNGAPVPGASVLLTPARVQGVAVFRASSGSDGGFRFDELPSGVTAVSAQLGEGPRELIWVTLEPAACRDDVQIVLPRTASLSVIVRDALGAPLPGQRVRVRRESAANDGDRGLAERPAVTDARGQLQLEALRSGQYVVEIPEWERRSVWLAEGAHVEVTLDSPVRQGLVGRVEGVEGRVVVVAERVEERLDELGDVARTAAAVSVAVDPRGRFELAVDGPGLFDVRAARQGGGAGPPVRAVVTPGALTEVVLSLSHGALGGRLTWDHDGRPAAGRRVSVRAADGRPVTQATTDADGRYHVPNLGPGGYRVEAAGWAHPADRARDHVARVELARVALVGGEQRLDVDGVLCRGSGLRLEVRSPWEALVMSGIALPIELSGHDGGPGPSRLVDLGEAAEFEELAAGTYDLRVLDPAHGELLRELPVALGEHERRELAVVLTQVEYQAMVGAAPRDTRLSASLPDSGAATERR